MYLPERLRALPMKSLYLGVLLAMVITLSLSFLVFHAICGSHAAERPSIPPSTASTNWSWRVRAEHWRSGGPKALKHYLTRLDRVFGGSTHYLLDARGVDVLTGENRAAFLPPAPRIRNGAPMRMAITSELTGRRTGSIGLSQQGLLRRPHIWTLSSLLLPGARRDDSSLLAGLGGRGVADPQDRGIDCALRSGQPLRSRAYADGRMRLANWGARSIRWPNASNG